MTLVKPLDSIEDLHLVASIVCMMIVTAVAAVGEQSADSDIGFEGRDDLRTCEHREI
jgi:hypothetical protein